MSACKHLDLLNLRKFLNLNDDAFKGILYIVFYILVSVYAGYFANVK